MTLVQDCWSTIHNNSVIIAETTKLCLQLSKQAKTEAEIKYGCIVKRFESEIEKNQNMGLQLKE